MNRENPPRIVCLSSVAGDALTCMKDVEDSGRTTLPNGAASDFHLFSGGQSDEEIELRSAERTGPGRRGDAGPGARPEPGDASARAGSRGAGPVPRRHGS